jgi:hypothetical protein
MSRINLPSLYVALRFAARGPAAQGRDFFCMFRHDSAALDSLRSSAGKALKSCPDTCMCVDTKSNDNQMCIRIESAFRKQRERIGQKASVPPYPPTLTTTIRPPSDHVTITPEHIGAPVLLITALESATLLLIRDECKLKCVLFSKLKRFSLEHVGRASNNIILT